jgi:hypothetical protein
MDQNSSNILSILSIIISFAGSAIAIFNHKRIRSKCCGHNFGETSIDIENTSPPSENKNLENTNGLKIDVK